MAKQIDKLTPEQESKLDFYRDKWMAIGRATGPASMESAKECISRAYEAAGLTPPVRWYHLESPAASALAQSFIMGLVDASDEKELVAYAQYRNWAAWELAQIEFPEHCEETRFRPWDRVWAQHLPQVRTKDAKPRDPSPTAKWVVVEDDATRLHAFSIAQQCLATLELPDGDVWQRMWDQLAALTSCDEDLNTAPVAQIFWTGVASVFQEACEGVPAVVQDAARQELWFWFIAASADFAGRRIWHKTRSHVGTMVTQQVYGNHDAYWLGFYEFFQKECGIEQVDRLQGLIDLAHHCGWWAPYDDCAFVQDRPEEIHFDGARLHNPQGPAVRYRDGFCVWEIEGIRVDEQIVMRPETQTIEQILAEENEEVKRLRINRFAGKDKDSTDGWLRFIAESDAEVIDARRNDIEVTRELLVQIKELRTLVVTCRTGRLFTIEVSPDCNTCEEAQAYLWGKGEVDRVPNIIGRS